MWVLVENFHVRLIRHKVGQDVVAVAVKASTEHRAGNIGNLDVWQDLIVYPSYEVRLTSIRANTIVRGFKSVQLRRFKSVREEEESNETTLYSRNRSIR